MAKRTIVDTAALNLVINALRRDEAEGFMARGEMADILLKTATEYVEPVCHPHLTECPTCKNQIGKCVRFNAMAIEQTIANPCGEIELSPPAPHIPNIYYNNLVDEMGTLIADWEQDGKLGLTREYIIKYFMDRNWQKRFIKKVLKENFEDYYNTRPYHKQ